MYRGNQPLTAAAMQPLTGTAVAGQKYIPIPGGINAGMNIVAIGGALLSLGDFDDSDGMGISLARPMAAGTTWQVISFTYNTSYVPVQGQLAGFRNLLINALGNVNHRSYVSGAATTIANQYTLDRWRVVTLGQSLAFAVNGNGRTLTAPAGGVEQVIEGSNIAGGEHSLNWLGTATATINGTVAIKRGVVTLPAGADATVRFSGGTFFQPQLESGSISTRFEQRHIGAEVQLCRRYCRLDLAGVLMEVTSGGPAGAVLTFDQPMRGAPSLSWVTNLQINGFAQTAPNLDTQSANGYRHWRTANGTGAGGGYSDLILASAEL